MKLSQLANPRILDQPVYQPGKPIEQVAVEYKLDPTKVCKLASNENPWGASPLAIAAGKTALDQVEKNYGTLLVTNFKWMQLKLS
jgi:histidinol-phosphate aminotransferase